MDSENTGGIPLFRNRIYIGAYWLALLSTLLGVALRLLIDPWLGNQMPYITFLVSVALTGLYAGARPALLSTVLGGVFAYLCFVPPRYHWGFAGISDAMGFCSYLAAALGTLLLTRARNEAHEETERTLRERINAERKLRDAQNLLQTFLHNRPGCAYLRNEDGQYIYCSNEARQLLGIGNEDASERTDLRLQLERRDQQLLATGGGPMQCVDKVKLQEHECYWLTTKFIFTNEENCRFIGSLSIDITGQMEAEQIAIEAERLAAAGQMVSMVAHEINNPLAALTNLLFLLGRETLPRPASELVTIAENELARLTHITRLTIGFYKQTELPVAMDPRKLVDDVITRLTAEFPGKQARIQRDFKWTGTFVACPAEIGQALNNVIANSLESGTRTIRIRIAPSRDWRLPSRTGLRISIFDDGRGMNPEQCKKAFEPFFSTKAAKGTGLGLWITKAISLRNRGRIALRSTENPMRHGTCVSIFLPDSVAVAHAPTFGAGIELNKNTATGPLGAQTDLQRTSSYGVAQ